MYLISKPFFRDYLAFCREAGRGGWVMLRSCWGLLDFLARLALVMGPWMLLAATHRLFWLPVGLVLFPAGCLLLARFMNAWAEEHRTEIPADFFD